MKCACIEEKKNIPICFISLCWHWCRLVGLQLCLFRQLFFWWSIDCTWCTQFSFNGDIVTHVDKDDVDNVFNYMWQESDGVTSGKHYWKIHFKTLDGGGGVGFTSKGYFAKGYRCRGLCFNGNLTDGSGLLVGNFGPSPVAGDTIGMLVSFKRNRIKIFFDLKVLGWHSK